MSRFNTGNPLDSDRLEDLSDNAKNMDLAVNSGADTFKDRMGRSRLTWTGIVKAGTGDPAIAVDAADRAVDAADRAESAESSVEKNAEQIAQDAAQQATSAVIAGVDGQVAVAQSAADRAETARNAAIDYVVNASEGIYENIAAGLAATASGQYFHTLGTISMPVLTLWKNVEGSAVKEHEYKNSRTVRIASNNYNELVDIDFESGILRHNIFRALIGSDQVTVPAQDVPMPDDRNRGFTYAVTLHVNNLTLSVYRLDELTPTILYNREVIYFYTEITRSVQLNAPYKINGKSLGHNTSATITTSSSNFPFLFDINTADRTLTQSPCRVVHNGSNYLIPETTISIGNFKSVAIAVTLNTETRTVSATMLRDLSFRNTDYAEVLLYVLYPKENAEGFGLTINQEFTVNGELPSDSSNVASFTLSVEPYLFDYSVDNEVVSHAAFRVILNGKSKYVKAQDFPMRLVSQSMAVLIDKSNLTLSAANVVTLTKESLLNKAVLYYFHRSDQGIKSSANFPYKIDGIPAMGGSGLTFAPYTLPNTNYTHVADFRFGEDVVVIPGIRVVIHGKSTLVRTDGLDISNRGGKSHTYALLVDGNGDLSVRRVQLLDRSDSNKFILFFFNEEARKVYTDLPYMLDGVLVSNSVSIEQAIIFDDSQPPTLLDVDDSHTLSDPMPLKGAFDLNTLMPHVVYGWFDDLVGEHPDYVTKIDLGFDESGTLPIYAYHFKPSEAWAAKEDTPRVFICAIHAETLNQVGLHVMMREICNGWDKAPRIAAMRFGFEFYVIPCAHPWGMVNKSRLNVNGVDINRNFPNGWVFGDEGTPYFSGNSPASEQETKVIMSVIEDFKPHVAIDYHAFHGGDAKWMWVVSNDKTYRTSTHIAALQTYQLGAVKFPIVKSRIFHDFYNCQEGSSFRGGLAGNYFLSQRAIGGTFETSRNAVGGDYVTNTEIVMGASMLLNTVYEGVKIYSLYGAPRTAALAVPDVHP